MTEQRYTPLVEDLPPIYRRDRVSYDQLAGYLGLVDDLQRGYIERLDEITSWLSPQALDVWPAGVPLDAGADRLLTAYREAFDELAGWFAYVFPGSWNDEYHGLDKKRRFLQRVARLWRRRGSPRGFVDWVSFAFDIADEHRPMLFEHFKYGEDPGSPAKPPWLRATLLVRSSDPVTNPAPAGQPAAVTNSTEQFQHFARRRELVEFVEASAPAHVDVRVCWVNLEMAPPADLEPPFSPAELADYNAKIRELLCTLADDVPHALAVNARECGKPDAPKDRLGIAKLPTKGRTITHTRHTGGPTP